MPSDAMRDAQPAESTQPPIDLAEVCRRCRFWERGTQQKAGSYNKETGGYDREPASWGYCRRYAPRGPMTAAAEDCVSSFVSTGEAEWCGEFEARQ